MDMVEESGTRMGTATTRLAPAAEGEYLSFRLGNEEYGINLLKVQEIRTYEPPTRIANAPPFFAGVLNLRGVIMPVIDFRMAFHCEFAAIDAFTVVIVLNVCHRLIGVVVDSVSDVLELSGSIIRAAPQMVSNGDSSFINGIASVHERTLILLDIEALMADRSMGLVAQTKEEVLEPASGSA